jgi:beta-N-acetylhexosaminidase
MKETPTQERRPAAPRKTLLIWSLPALALIVALPLGAYLTLKLTQQQQAQAGLTPAATTGAGATPRTLDPERREAQFITQMIAQMSLPEELGQMIMVEWDEGGVFNDDLQYMLVNQHAGGLILYSFNGNIQTIAQTAALDAAVQAHASIPVFIATDQEGGEVNRLAAITGYRPSAREIAASNDPTVAYRQGVSDGQLLKQVGINLNLAPDVDVQSLSDATYDASEMSGFEYRMYGTTPEQVAAFAGAYLNGLQDQGVIGTLKHWPGIGGVTVDPHDTLPVLNRSQADLNKIDFAPYRTLIAQGSADMVMSTHELVPAYDSTMPTSLSPIMINQVLRHDLGYQGVVITDGLYMAAIRQHWTMAQAAVLAVIAGNDMLLGPWDRVGMQSMIDALQAAVASGQISKARIDLSMQRILALKIRYGLIKIPSQGER